MSAKLTVAGRDRICYRCNMTIFKGRPIIHTESRRAGTVTAKSYLVRFYHPEHYTDAHGSPLLSLSVKYTGDGGDPVRKSLR